jgi:mRNA interferase RelE/StbE
MTYIVDVPEKFEKEFTKRHRDKTQWLERAIEALEQNPEYGKPLGGRLHGIWQLKTGPFRLWYEINNKENKVTLRVFLHKDEAIKQY